MMLAVAMLLPLASHAQADCSGLAIPYAEDFDSYSGNATGTTAPSGYPDITLPNCWSFIGMSSSTSNYPQVFLTSSTNYASSGNCLFFKSSSTIPLFAVMPEFTTSGILQLGFTYRNEGISTSNGTIIVGVLSNPSDSSSFIMIESCERTTTKTHKDIFIPAGTLTNGARLAFKYVGGTSNNYYAAIDDVVLQAAPSCLPVSDLTVSNPTTTTLTLSWSDLFNTGATYTVYNMADTSVIASGISGTTYTVTNLAPASFYFFSVASDCGSGDVSPLVNAVRGKTDCVPMALPYSTSFEAEELAGTANSDALPLCWNRYSTGNGNYTYYPYSYSSTSYPHSGSRLLYFYGGSSTLYPDTMVAILPAIDVATYPMNGNRLTFWSRVTSTSGAKDVQIGTMSDPTDISTFTLVNTTSVNSTTNQLYSVPLGSATATHPYVAIMVLRNSSGGYLCIDDVTLEPMPSCLEVSNLAADTVTPTSVTLSWNDTENSNATYTVTNSVSGTVFASNVTGNTYTVTGLNPNTLYSFGVQANCTSGDASVMTVLARTACSSISLPYSTGFEASELVGTTNAQALPYCWTRYASGTGNYTYYPYSYYSSTYAHDGSSRSLYFYGSTSVSYPDTMIAILPAIDVATYPMNGNRISFYARTSGASYTKNLLVGTMTDPADPSTFALVSEVEITGTTHQLYTVPMLAASPSAPHIALMLMRNSGSLYIDDLTVETLPSCVEPASLDVETNATSATVSWYGVADSYTLSLYNNGTEVGSPVTVTSTEYTYTDLTVGQDYTVHVVSNCGSDVSTSSSTSFHIGYCSPNPTSVDNSGITNVSFGGMTNTTSHPSSAPYFMDNTTMAGSIPAGTTADIDITVATGYSYGFVIWVDWDNSMSFDGDEVVYVGQTTNANPYQFTASFAIPATTPVGNYRMRIAAADSHFDSFTGSIEAAASANPCFSSSYSTAEDYTLTVTEVPSCMAPTGVVADNVTANNVTLTWNGTASSYNVYDLSTVGTVTLLGNTSNNSYTVTGLSPMTQYTFGVASVCGSEESTVVNTTVNTACAALTMPYVEDFAETSATRNCWTFVSNNSANDVGTSNGMGFVTINNASCWRFSSFTSASDYNQYGYSPDFVVSNDATALNVKVHYATYGNNDQLTFGYITATDTVWDATSHSTSGQTDFQTYETFIPANAVKLAVNYYGNFSYYAWIDSVMVSEINASDECTVTLPYTETFDTMPTCWTIIDGDGDGFSWEIENYFGVSVFHSKSYMNNVGVLTPDNWLISPQITLPSNSNYEVSWSARPQDVNYPAEHYGLYISTTTNDTTAFTLVQQWTLSSNDDPAYPVINLSAYAGQSIYLALRHWDCSDEYWLTIDNFTVREQPNANQVVVNVSANDAFYGTVSGNGVYTTGDNVTVTATPNTNYIFAYWMDDNDTIVSTSNPFTFVAANNVNLQAIFTTVPQNPDTATYIMAVNDATMGTVTPAPGIYQIADGTNLTISATANAGYHFAYWDVQYYYTGALTTTTFVDNPLTLMSNLSNYTPLTFTAVFEEDLVCNGTTCDLVISGSDAYGDGWNGGSIQVKQNNSTIHTFTVDMGYDSDTIEVCSDYPVQFYWLPGSYDDEVSFIVSNSNGELFNIVSGEMLPDTLFAVVSNVCSSNATVDLLVDVDSLTVNIAVNDATMGTTNPAPGTYQIGQYDIMTVTATPNPGYYFHGWAFSYNVSGTVYYDTAMGATNDVLSVEGDYWYDASPVTFTALFFNYPYESDSMLVNIAVNNAAMGTTSPAPGAHYLYEGDTCSVIAIPYPGHMLEGWDVVVLENSDTIINQYISSSEPDVFNLFDQPIVVGAGYNAYKFFVTAYFAEDTNSTTEGYLTLITAVNDASMGTINPAPGVHQYSIGDTVNFSVYPNEGYHLSSANVSITFMGVPFIDTTVSDIDLSTIDLEVDESMIGMIISVTANFAANGSQEATLTVTVNDDAMGYVLINGSQSTTYHGTMGETVNVEAVANQGYDFVRWSDGNTNPSRTITLEDNVTTLEAIFQDQDAIDVADNLDNVKVYPNPTYGIVNIDADNVVSVEVMDINGRVAATFENTSKVDLSNLTAGTYMLRIQTANGIFIKKVVKK